MSFNSKYFDRKAGSLEEAILKTVRGEAFEPHMMYDPKTGKGYKADTMDDHLRMKKMGYGHEAPKNESNLDEAKGTTKYVVMQGPGDNNQKVIATFDGGDNALQKAKKFRDDWNTKNKRKIKLDKKGKPISAHMARIFAKGAETSYKVGNKVSYSEFAPSLVKEENLDEIAPVVGLAVRGAAAGAASAATNKIMSSKKAKKKEETELDELSAAQKKLPPALQKAIKAKEGKKEDVSVKEKLVGGQKKLDKDKDGDIDGKDFAMLRKSKSKSKSEAFEYGTPEATVNSLNMTPGQSTDDWNETVGVIQKKNATMREALAKMWGVEEGHNPFRKEEKVPKGHHRMPDGTIMKDSDMDKKEDKTMTGKPMTKVDVDPDVKEKRQR